jgi:hypothetical protein
VQSRLPEVLAQGLAGLSPVPNQIYRQILEFLVSNPSPQAVLEFGPSPETQERVRQLLERNRSDGLTPGEADELEEYGRIDHLVTLLKARALPYLVSGP